MAHKKQAEMSGAEAIDDIVAIHNRCHLGVNRTYELLKECYPEANKETLTQLVQQCDRCAKIDPAVTVRWERGTISEGSIWKVLSVDIAYIHGVPYLSVIHVFSSYTIWRKLSAETAISVTGKIRENFANFGPPESILSDNGTVLRSHEMMKLLQEWKVQQTLACASSADLETFHRGGWN